VVHAALTAAAPYGYRLLNPVGGETRTLLGAPVPGGSLDNAAFLTTMDAAQLTPTGQYVVLIEVKNIREWIYPSAAELLNLFRDLTVYIARRTHGGTMSTRTAKTVTAAPAPAAPAPAKRQRSTPAAQPASPATALWWEQAPPTPKASPSSGRAAAAPC
jgi:hypothetical protein